MAMVLVPTKPMESSMVRNLAWRRFFPQNGRPLVGGGAV
jgi:hypothetical protein